MNTTEPMGFGLALLKEEGGSYRKMTPAEIAERKAREAYSKTPMGRFRRFLHRVGVAWAAMTQKEDSGW